MKDMIFDNFQDCVNESLIRHKSILDVLTKYSESTALVNRSIAKAVTNCGCIKINASKQHLPDQNSSIENLNNYIHTHLAGEPCDNCREIIEKEIGNNIFYLTSLCNNLNINLYDVFIKEYSKLSTLGKFNLR
ncbi:hypothetical protein [Clostridium saccharobutylicum]|uniref:DUF1573 domain-containing protein n=1 Tax=Clostridium saccharobutylicum DSM 13864 TaxID=1345695 RepID=U5MK89_CLOSA|nr:hypothetical protein [Clostridium saccharobutylicum]AGX41229.1 hypothetical protein CLSA_c01760 [Clostridium saccharobutylicum DSM 13864]AQR88515.1 hypothetical protein CLOSC_01760 [Clostridium saccharobutylicum]AQR98413.1 hypothetical protein CSACC_01760 [Clostridium saccharobutylicum]AQS08124.1 hypothetical protein CLOBY_01930 [Clostridium saccharobutylicum]AQS12403.1 hypothetical protein CLOSACC_01760 [Clostridium saccharobutylicum]